MAYSLPQSHRTVHRVIEPPSGWRLIDWREIWQYRDLLLALAGRDVKLRYRQTALGMIWVLLGPLFSAGVFSFIFTNLAGLPTDGVPGLLFIYAGVMAYNVFASTVQRTSGVLIGNQQLVSKIYFPRMILPFSALFAVLLDFAVALGVAAALMVFFRFSPPATILLLPFWLFSIFLFATGIGLFASALMVTYRDVGPMIGVLTQILMYISPVVYPISLVAAKMGPLLGFYYLNPMAGLIQGYRWSLVGTSAPPAAVVLYAVGFAGAIFVVGAMLFNRMESRFADVI